MLAIKVLSSEAFYCLVVTREGDLSAHTADVPSMLNYKQNKKGCNRTLSIPSPSLIFSCTSLLRSRGERSQDATNNQSAMRRRLSFLTLEPVSVIHY